jgi:hypothetical protein
MLNKFPVSPENAPTILKWMKERGGVAIWSSANLSNPGQTWTTPLNNEDGTPRTEKPNWQADRIIRRITSLDELEIIVGREVRRFRVGLRRGAQGLTIKLTDASSRKLRTACSRVAEEHGDSWYEFDYSTQEAVIFASGERFPLTEENCSKLTSVGG